MRTEPFKYKENPNYETNLLVLKPDCLERGKVPDIINNLLQRGYSISSIRVGRLTEEVIEELYYEVKEKYPDLYSPMLDYLLSGPVIVMLVHGPDVLTNAKNIIGNTRASDEMIKGCIRELRILPEDLGNYPKKFDYINLAHYPKSPKEGPKTFEVKKDSEAIYNGLESVKTIRLENGTEMPTQEYLYTRVLTKLRFKK